MEKKFSFSSQTVEINKDIISCIICLEVSFDSSVFDCCYSIICNSCLEKYIKTSKKCPMCRKEKAKATSNVMLKKIISGVNIKCPLGCGHVTSYIDTKTHLTQSHKDDELLNKENLNMLVNQFNFKIFDEKIFNLHMHKLLKISTHDGWKCKGKLLFPNEKEKCLEGSAEVKYINYCNDCNYEICDKCIEIKNVKEFSVGSFHQHNLFYNDNDNGWRCDGRNAFSDGCKSGITSFHQTDGIKRFRCDPCDFDLCEKCLIYALCNKN